MVLELEITRVVSGQQDGAARKSRPLKDILADVDSAIANYAKMLKDNAVFDARTAELHGGKTVESSGNLPES